MLVKFVSVETRWIDLDEDEVTNLKEYQEEDYFDLVWSDLNGRENHWIEDEDGNEVWGKAYLP